MSRPCSAIKAIPLLASAILLLASNGFAAQPVVFGWGANTQGEVSGLSNVTQIAAGGGLDFYYGPFGGLVDFGVALQASGTITVWGDNTYGETNVPPGLSDVMAIAAGGYHGLALQSNGTVVACSERQLCQCDRRHGNRLHRDRIKCRGDQRARRTGPCRKSRRRLGVVHLDAPPGWKC